MRNIWLVLALSVLTQAPVSSVAAESIGLTRVTGNSQRSTRSAPAMGSLGGTARGTILYPGVGGDQSHSDTRWVEVDISEPASFKASGVYVWRDRSGLWNIKTTLDGVVSVSGTLSSDGSLSVVRYGFSDYQPQVLFESVALPSTRNGLNSARFSVEGGYVDIDIRIEGLHEPGRVFIGQDLLNPTDIPFRIAAEPLASTCAGTVDDAQQKNQWNQGFDTDGIRLEDERASRAGGGGISTYQNR
jgi:hypothetical protein